MLENKLHTIPAAGCEIPAAGFVFSGLVVKGNQLGRTIGFPTANLQVEGDIPVPAGVFACKVGIGNGTNLSYRAMLNVGTRPTVSHGSEVSVEVNIFDFSGDIYGRILWVEIVKPIRRERKFPDLAALQQQLQADRQAAMACLA